MTSRPLFFLILLALAGCDSGEPNQMSLADFEGPAGEAVIRYMIAHLPPMEPQVPKVYAIVAGPALAATSPDFAARFADLKLNFVSADTLKVREMDKAVVDPVSGLSPVTLQIREMKRQGAEGFEVVGGWAYKKTWERRRYKLAKTAAGYEVQDAGRIEGNYTPEN